MALTASPALPGRPPSSRGAPTVSLPAAQGAEQPAFARGWRRYVVALVGWTAAGIVLIQQSYAATQITGHPRPIAALVVISMVDMWLWALFTPAIMDLGRDFPLDREHWAARLPLHVAAAIGFAIADALIMWVLRPHLCDCAPKTLASEFSERLFANEASYFVLAAMGVAARYARQSRERERAGLALAKELADARLAALNAQLRPHFLFNTLNAIAELVHVDAQAADRTVTALGGLLRRSLAAGDRQEVPLREELACVDEYLAIVSTRLDERLRVSTAIAPETLDARVPSFLLQPLVENAVRHGIERTPDGGQVELAAWRDGDWLHVEVRDDGAGLRSSASPHAGGGHGLRTTRERLRHLYGDAHAFELRAPGTGHRGAVAAVRLPFSLAT
jgi:two-component system, LytTR family, sensor kinase